MKLYSDKPTSQGMENALKRARQMVDFRWTPIRPVPAGTPNLHVGGDKGCADCFLPALRPRYGVIYSSVRQYEKYVGVNVSFETFTTALANPDSVIYTRSQHGAGRRVYNFYGSVCSGFASYVFDLPVRLPCSRWPKEPGVFKPDLASLNDLNLCDIVLKVGDHIAVVTAIQRDAEGNARLITVSEETLPSCIAVDYTPEEFRAFWLEKGYEIYRYAHLDRIPYTPDPYVYVEGDPDLPVPPVNKAFMTDYGDKANYMLGESVLFSVFEPEWNEIRITGADNLTLSIKDGKACFTPDKPGFYTAVCAGEGAVSQAVNFCVTSISMRVDKPHAKAGGEITMSFENSAPGDEPLGYIIHCMNHFMRGRGVFTEAEKAERKTILEKVAPGEYTVFVLAKNKYGVYRAEGCAFTVTE